MITKSELLRQRVNQEANKVEQEKLKEQAAKEREGLRQAKDMCRVETMLDTDLGDILKAASAAGLDTIRLGCSRVWQPSSIRGKSTWNQYYGYVSPLQFDPKKGYSPTTRLVKILKQAGFQVNLDIVQHQNFLTVGTADGYDFERLPGTYPVYYMRISWATDNLLGD